MARNASWVSVVKQTTALRSVSEERHPTCIESDASYRLLQMIFTRIKWFPPFLSWMVLKIREDPQILPQFSTHNTRQTRKIEKKTEVDGTRSHSQESMQPAPSSPLSPAPWQLAMSCPVERPIWPEMGKALNQSLWNWGPKSNTAPSSANRPSRTWRWQPPDGSLTKALRGAWNQETKLSCTQIPDHKTVRQCWRFKELHQNLYDYDLSYRNVQRYNVQECSL